MVEKRIWGVAMDCRGKLWMGGCKRSAWSKEYRGYLKQGGDWENRVRGAGDVGSDGWVLKVFLFPPAPRRFC